MSVLFAQVPSFYAAIERAADPALAGRPVIVGGDPRKAGRVQSASADARAAGVEEGMPMIEALGRCPRARALRTDMRRYREVSQRLYAELRRAFERLEPAGLDAAYADGASLRGPAERVAGELCRRVEAELRLPLRVGIAEVRFVAKLAAEEGGERGVHRVAAGGEAEFLRPLPVSRLPGVGPNTALRLSRLGAETVGDLMRLGPERLEAELGRRGRELLSLAGGRGDTRVRAVRPRQSLSQESTFEAEQLDVGVLSERLLELARRLEEGLQLEDRAASRVSVKVRYADRETTTRSRTLGAPVQAAGAIHREAEELLRLTQAGARPVRLVGISLSGFRAPVRDDRQLDLFSRPA